MLTLRPSAERGRAEHGWLSSRFTFSFADYYDPRHMGYRVLRVINEDHVLPGQGFPTHPHRDMEILTWVLEGELEHKDSLGNGSIIRPGELQAMSAGTGVLHSEFNPSKSAGVHLLQIWILPRKAGIAPRYDQKSFAQELAGGEWVLLASPEAERGSVALHQDATLSVARLPSGGRAQVELEPGRHGWLQVARGECRLGDLDLVAGDGVAIEEERSVPLVAASGAEVLLFDLP